MQLIDSSPPGAVPGGWFRPSSFDGPFSDGGGTMRGAVLAETEDGRFVSARLASDGRMHGPAVGMGLRHLRWKQRNIKSISMKNEDFFKYFSAPRRKTSPCRKGSAPQGLACWLPSYRAWQRERFGLGRSEVASCTGWSTKRGI